MTNLWMPVQPQMKAENILGDQFSYKRFPEIPYSPENHPWVLNLSSSSKRGQMTCNIGGYFIGLIFVLHAGSDQVNKILPTVDDSSLG